MNGAEVLVFPFSPFGFLNIESRAKEAGNFSANIDLWSRRNMGPDIPYYRPLLLAPKRAFSNLILPTTDTESAEIAEIAGVPRKAASGAAGLAHANNTDIDDDRLKRYEDDIWKPFACADAFITAASDHLSNVMFDVEQLLS